MPIAESNPCIIFPPIQPLTHIVSQGDYEIVDGLFDLSILSRVPMDTGRLTVNMTFLQKIPETKKTRQLLCLDAIVTLTQSKTGHRPRRRP